MARNRSNIISPETVAPVPQNNVITAHNAPAMRNNVIRPIASAIRPNDKVWLVPTNGGGRGAQMTRERAMKAVKTSNGGFIIKEL